MRVRGIQQDRGGLSGLMGKLSGGSPLDLHAVLAHRPKLLGRNLGKWLQELLRGDSAWTVGERELFACYAAQHESCEPMARFHGAVAAVELGDDLVKQVRMDPRAAAVGEATQAALAFIQKMSLNPDDLDASDVARLRDAGLDTGRIQEVVQICAASNVMARLANALGFATPGPKQLGKAAKASLRDGYAQR